jgi:radical SAM protein with 4Fe4S-binding SPASM domain
MYAPRISDFYSVRKIEDQYLFLFPDVPYWFMVNSEEKRTLIEDFLDHSKLSANIDQEVQEFKERWQLGDDFEEFITDLKHAGVFLSPDEKSLPRPVPDLPRLAQVAMEVTKACNLTCKHCSISAGDPRAEELTLEELRSFLTEVITLMKGRKEVIITGGEPFMRSDIFETMEVCQALGFKRIVVLTNGTLIGERMGERLKELNERIEMKNTSKELVQRLHIQVSVDGLEKTHDFIRGRNTWKKAIRAARILRSNTIATSLGMVVSKLNFNDVEEVIKVAAALDCNIGFSSLIMTGRATEGILDPIPVNRVIPIIIDYLEQNPTHLKYLTNFPHSPYIIAFRNLIKFRYCGTGWATVYLDSEGHIYPCSLGATVPEFRAGNIRENSFHEIWQHSPILKKLRTLHVDTLNTQCSTCELRYFCGGGCRTQAYLSTRTLDGMDPKCIIGENKGTAWGAFRLMVKHPQILEEVSELGIVRLMEGLFEEMNT